MKKEYFLLISLMTILSLTAQNNSVIEKNQFKVNILSPGFSLEHGLNKKSTLSSELNLSVGFNSDGFNENSNIIIAPYIKEQYRYYYNLDKRIAKRKNVSKNSGNFLAINASYYFGPINNSEFISSYDGFTLAPIWGLQRTYKSNLNVNINAGIGCNFSNKSNKNAIIPVLNFTLGWVIGK